MHFLELRLGWKDAGITGALRVPWVDGHELPVEAYGRALDERHPVGHAAGVDQLPCTVVVAAIEHHAGFGHERIEQVAVGPLLHAAHLHIGVEGRDGAAHGLDLGQAHAGRVMRYLALEVGEVDGVVIHDGESADSGGREVQGRGRSQAACAENEHVGRENPFLALDADFVEQDMA